MERTPDRSRDPRARWAEAGSGRHYAETRWGSEARRTRDPRRIRRLLERRAHDPTPGRILDAPCGTGRLRPVLSDRGEYVGLDVSRPMLGAAGDARLVQGELEHLPFPDRSFDTVVCCRLLHHLTDDARLDRVVRELVRVSSAWVVMTFWDAASLPAWHRTVFPRRRASLRVARHRSSIQALFTAAGAPIVDWDASLRFLSRQTYGLARRRAREG